MDLHTQAAIIGVATIPFYGMYLNVRHQVTRSHENIYRIRISDLNEKIRLMRSKDLIDQGFMQEFIEMNRELCRDALDGHLCGGPAFVSRELKATAASLAVSLEKEIQRYSPSFAGF